MAADAQVPMPESTETISTMLVERLRRGDPAAMGILQSRYRARLVQFCWGYLEDIEEAEDAVQDVFCKVLEAAVIPDQFRPWVYRVARNHCLNLLRSRARRVDRAAIPAASQVGAALTGQLTGMVRDEARAKVISAVAQLPESVREALRLRYVENLSRAEIAEILEVPESQVKSRLFEGLQKLRETVPLDSE